MRIAETSFFYGPMRLKHLGVRIITCGLLKGRLNLPYNNGRVFTSNFSGRLASDNRKSRKNTCFSDSLKVKRVGKLQCNSH